MQTQRLNKTLLRRQLKQFDTCHETGCYCRSIRKKNDFILRNCVPKKRIPMVTTRRTTEDE